MRLLVSGLTKFLAGILLVGLPLFLAAGTLKFFGGWLFLSALFLPMLVMGVVMFVKAPELLKSRLDSKEKRDSQRGVVKLLAFMFLVGFVVSGLDYRFGWSHVPKWAVFAALALFVISYLLYAEVMRENAYLSRTIKVCDGQKVVDTGLYSIVRHPMYMATVFMFLSIPVMLGSWYAVFIFLVYPFAIAARIKDEEKLLLAELDGYSEYRKKVKHKIIPYIW